MCSRVSQIFFFFKTFIFFIKQIWQMKILNPHFRGCKTHQRFRFFLLPFSFFFFKLQLSFGSNLKKRCFVLFSNINQLFLGNQKNKIPIQIVGQFHFFSCGVFEKHWIFLFLLFIENIGIHVKNVLKQFNSWIKVFHLFPGKF